MSNAAQRAMNFLHEWDSAQMNANRCSACDVKLITPLLYKTVGSMSFCAEDFVVKGVCDKCKEKKDA